MPKYSEEDKLLEDEIKNSLKVSSYVPEIFKKLQGSPLPKNMVPDFSDGKNKSFSNETSSLFSIEESMFDTAASSLGTEGVISAMSDAWNGDSPYTVKLASSSPNPVAKIPQKTSKTLSARQYLAVQKYPALIELLGSEDGDAIVNNILSKVNEIMVEKISKNSREISKNAQACVSEKQNIKQYFVGDNDEWVCVLTASGAFRGDEAFYYDKEKDDARIMRIVNGDYQDVTPQFNLIHELAEKE